MNHNEKMNAVETGVVSVSKDQAVLERSEAHGTYRVRNIGPLEQYRDEYVALRDRINAKGFRAFLDKLINGASLIRDFAAIPLEEKWAEECPNVVCTVGKNLALDTYLAGSAYTVVGPYMGLINTNASAAVAGDTMSSHSGWLEVGGTNAPTYSGTRKTAAWSSASAGSKALSAALSFAITSSGSVGGCFLVFGSGAVNTIDNTSGTLYSAGAFTGGTKTVSNGDTLNVSYTASL